MRSSRINLHARPRFAYTCIVRGAGEREAGGVEVQSTPHAGGEGVLHSRRDALRTRGAVFALTAALIAPSSAVAADVLLIPDSVADQIMAFDPNDGTLLDPAFIPDPGVVNNVDVFRRPLNAIASGNGTVLVSDQFADLVAEFDFDGNFLGVFSNGGQVDTDILNNVRGIDVRANGELLVSNTGSGILPTSNSIVRFDTAGNLGASFIFSRYGGIRGPFDVLVLDDMILVADEGSDFIARYTIDGRFDELFARNLNFPQQMNRTASNTILVAVFSGGFIAEFDMNGQQIGQFDPGGLSGYRGVIELGNGNLLVTTGTGVHEVTRLGIVVATEFAGSEARYIERVTLPPTRSIAEISGKARSGSAPADGAAAKGGVR
jgi:hypothetical protein